MCLNINEKLTEQEKSKTGWFWAYKVVNANLTSKYYKHVWKPGWNKADSIKTQKRFDGLKRIENAIHVVAKIKFTKKWLHFDGGKVLKVKCYYKDIVGVENDSFYHANLFALSNSEKIGEYALTKVFLPKAEFMNKKRGI